VSFRKISITAQFSIAIGLILCTLLTYRQMEFIAHYDLGFRKNNVVVLDAPIDPAYAEKLKAFKTALAGNKNVSRVSNLSYGALPGTTPDKGDVKTRPGGEIKFVNFMKVDENYLPTLNIALREGRNFDAMRVTDKEQAVIVNESFVKAWDWNDPLQEAVQWNGKEMKVIGVIKDFHFSSLYQKIEPTMLMYDETTTLNVLISFDDTYPVSDQIPFLMKEWKRIFSDQPFVYSFLDDALATQYITEEKAVALFTIFSILTIVVSCLGLFGLCSLTISQRRKEIGIRKIVGASFISIISMFSKEYLLLIALSFAITAPIALLLMNRWLESFPMKENISVYVFIATGIGVMSMGLLTIVLSIARTSNTNPSHLIQE